MKLLTFYFSEKTNKRQLRESLNKLGYKDIRSFSKGMVVKTEVESKPEIEAIILIYDKYYISRQLPGLYKKIVYFLGRLKNYVVKGFSTVYKRIS